MESAENSSECVPNDSKKDKKPPPLSLLAIAETRRERLEGFFWPSNVNQPHMEVEKGNVSGLNGKVIQEDMDQRNSVANDINKILRGVESMSNKLEDLSSRVQLMEAVLQKFQQNQPGFSFSPVEESQGIPCDQNIVWYPTRTSCLLLLRI
ncbi:unnamed protein product [Lactuca virosa]|uniref:Uncharacterized protein n=1 Tax=Lactuca virosa TaxID=75947 RepID=A0AAU9P9G4_9ASTR|nr:unnamed protein product [Lactuca virosa]